MSHNIIIKRCDKVIYHDDIMNIPIKEDVLIKRSIDLFADDDPCIIHQSFIVNEFADQLQELLNNAENHKIYFKDVLNKVSFIDYLKLEELSMERE